MSAVVCLYGNTLFYPRGGGHFWVYLNWAPGLRAVGCRVIWLEGVPPDADMNEIRKNAGTLETYLVHYGFEDSLELCSTTGRQLPQGFDQYGDCHGSSAADLFLNLGYAASRSLVERFPRSALIDIDPGLLQTWMAEGHIEVPRHNCYFTIGETVGQPGSRFPDAGLKWQYTPPCVSLDWWAVHGPAAGAAFTTVSHWSEREWLEDNGKLYRNDKRNGFLPFLDLPLRSPAPLELALCLGEDEQEEKCALMRKRWRIRNAHEVGATPWDYQSYVQSSRGEFSCAKPSCVRFQNAWISDRTICYLASGKPAIVQHTGTSRFLPDCEGLFRFRDIDEAAHYLDAAMSDYSRHCAAARALAETYFDARKVAASVLERALS